MIIINALLHVAPFDTVVESVGRIRRHLLTKQIKGKGIVQVQFLLDRWQVNDAKIPDFRDVIWISDPSLVHRIQSRLDRATNTRFANEHVVGFFGQHKAHRA